jgi:hypothetical protein
VNALCEKRASKASGWFVVEGGEMVMVALRQIVAFSESMRIDRSSERITR